MKHAKPQRSHPSTATNLKPADWVFTALTSLIAAVYLELFREVINSFRDGDEVGLLHFSITPSAAICIVGAFALVFILLVFLQKQKRVLAFLFKWRYPLALALFVVLVVAQISGSSLALWDSLLDGAPNADLRGVLFGMPRTIRTDEYVVFTPMAFSQAHTGYAALSDLVRSVPTDLTLVYAQPCWDIATLFRPFLWGFLVLGSAYGLSVFWCGRLIVLFLASLEFGRHIMRDNRLAAFGYALMITFSPIVQWWFAVNGTAELLIFAQGGILAFSSFLRATTRLRRFAFAAIAAYSAGCFVMVIYPGWQVCIAYFIVAFCIAEIVSCRTKSIGALARGIGVRQAFVSYWLALICALIIVAALVVTVVLSSTDVVQAVRGSSYPGQRVSTGGGLTPLLFDWASSWLYPLAFDHTTPNACDRAGMFSLFPLGIVLSFVALRRQRNAHLIALLCVEAILLLYGIVGFPEWLAKLTLLSNVPNQRLPLALGLSDISLLCISLTVLQESSQSRRTAKLANGAAVPLPAIIAISILFGAVSAAGLCFLHASFAHRAFVILCGIMVAVATYAALALASGRKNDPNGLVCIAVVMALFGCCVNPVQQGIAALEDSETLNRISPIAEGNPGSVWAGDNNRAAQALLSAGIRTINSTAIYPDLDTWRKVDPDGVYEDAYNRYAHITMIPTMGKTSFESPVADTFTVNLNVDDIPKLGIDYWLSQSDLTAFNTDHVTFTEVETGEVWKLFRIDYERS